MADSLSSRLEQTLKPCPFCGGAPFSVAVTHDDEGYWAVECTTCNGGAPGRFCGVHGEDQDEAERLWNERRVTPSETRTVTLPIEVVSLLNTAATHLRTWVLTYRRGSKDMSPYANTESVAERLDYFIAHGELPKEGESLVQR